MHATNGSQKGTPWRLRTRLSLALVALFIGVFVLILVSHFQRVQEQRDYRVEDMEKVNETVAAVFDGFMGDLESFGRSTAITFGDGRVPVTIEDQPRLQPTVGPFLQHLFESYGILRSMFITDIQGRVVYSNAGAPPGLDLSSRNYIRALQAGAEDYWSGGFPGAESGNTTIAYARAIKTPEGATSGFLVIAFYPSQLASRLPEGLAEEGNVSLIDDTGTVVLSLTSAGEESPAGDVSSWPAFESARSGSYVLVKDEDIPLGEDRYGSLVPLQNTGWVVGYTLPTSAVEGSTTAWLQRELVVVSAILGAGLVLMLLLAGRLSRPLARLAASAGAISRGEYSTPLKDFDGADAEISALASAMAEMQETIRVREARLRNQAIVIESIERMGESLSQNLDTDAAIASIADAGMEVAEAQAVILFARDETTGEFTPAGRSGDSELDIGLDAPLLLGVFEGATVHVANIEDLPGDGDLASDGHLPRSALACPIFLRSGQVGGVIVFLKTTPDGFDIINQRLAGGLARWSGIVLENARLYRQSQGVQELLRQANGAKDEFLAIVSHELRTPITTIYGGTRLLRLRRDKLPEQAINDMFESIAEEAENLYLLVEDLLAIARTEMSEPIEREPVLLSSIIEQAVSNFARSSNHEVLVRIPPDLPVVLGESTYLNQVVTNLLSNAHKYSPADLPIEVEAAAEENAVIVRVMDRGNGVPAEELHQIFERFYRSRSTAERASGKGLGLTVCKRLVEAISGEIWAENRPDSGLIVSVKLEAAEDLTEQVELSSPTFGAMT